MITTEGVEMEDIKNQEYEQLITKQEELLQEKNKLKRLQVNLWKMQNADFDMYEKHYKFTDMTWTDIAYRGQIIETIEKPITEITTEDMFCIIHKRNYMLTEFPYSRIDEIKENLDKYDEKELEKYTNYIDRYNFWKSADVKFDEAIKSFNKIVDDENSFIFCKDDVELAKNSIEEHPTKQYQEFLNQNSVISIKTEVKDNSEYGSSQDWYKRKLYLNGEYLRTTNDRRVNVGFEDLMYLYREYTENVDAFNISAYKYKRQSLINNIDRAMKSGNIIKVFKSKAQLKKLDKTYKSLNDIYEYWINNRYNISKAIISYCGMNKDDRPMKAINEQLSTISTELKEMVHSASENNSIFLQ